MKYDETYNYEGEVKYYIFFLRKMNKEFQNKIHVHVFLSCCSVLLPHQSFISSKSFDFE